MKQKYMDCNMYQDPTQFASQLDVHGLFGDEENFWDTGGTTKVSVLPTEKCSNMPAPSSEIWDKLDLPTPPRSPCIFDDIGNSDILQCSEDSLLSNLSDLYNLTDLCGLDIDDCSSILGCDDLISPDCDSKSAVILNDLIHDCMWSGQCTNGCKSNSNPASSISSTSKSPCSSRTRCNSFGSISSLSDLGFHNRAATPISSLSGASFSLLPGASIDPTVEEEEDDDDEDDFPNCSPQKPTNSCSGPSALSDHSYSTIRQHSNHITTSYDEYSNDESCDDEDDESDESEDEESSKQTYLGIPTPSDSEEEIDVVGVYDTTCSLTPTRQIRTVKTNLPTKPNATQRRSLQLAVEKAARKNSSVICGTKRKEYGVEDDSTYYPSQKRKCVGKNMMLLSKGSTHGNRKSGHSRKNSKKNSSSRAECSDSLNSNIKDRTQHNHMERKRREDLRSSFFHLRDQVPELVASQRASKVNILIKASEYIRKLQTQESHYDRLKKQEQKRHQELTKRIQLLQRQKNGAN